MKILSFFFLVISFAACSSAKMVEQYRGPDSVNFEANKVLVIGITENKEVRRAFEKSVAEALEAKGVIAVKSIDFFESSFTNHNKTEAELNKIEARLLEAGFDAVLFGKITGQRSKVSLVQSYRSFAKPTESFRDYYYSNQHIFQKEQEETYRVYQTETSLYCICPDKARELIWQGEMEITDAQHAGRNIQDYTRTLIKTLQENNILLVSQ